MRTRRDFRREAPLEAWIWRAVVNAARKRRGRYAREVPPSPGPATANGTGPEDERAELATLIAALPERQRLVLFLRYYADLDYRGIAEILRVEVGTVRHFARGARESSSRSQRGSEMNEIQLRDGLFALFPPDRSSDCEDVLRRAERPRRHLSSFSLAVAVALFVLLAVGSALALSGRLGGFFRGTPVNDLTPREQFLMSEFDMKGKAKLIATRGSTAQKGRSDGVTVVSGQFVSFQARRFCRHTTVAR